MKQDIDGAITLLIENFFLEEPQTMEEVTQALDLLNNHSSAQTLASLGHKTMITMAQMHIARLRTHKLIITSGLH